MSVPEIAPELVERMVALTRKHAEKGGDWKASLSEWKEAQAIVAELPTPVDPDLIEAREQAARGYEGSYKFPRGADQASEIRAGQRDHRTEVKVALAAIKRGRQLQQEGK